MMLKVERDGSYTTYVCRHLQVTDIRPGSEVAKREGNRAGIQIELTGVTSVTKEQKSENGFQVTTETRPSETVYVHLPTDGEAAYQMDANRNTTNVWRPKAERRAS